MFATMRVVVVLCAVLALATAGRSPNADVVEEILKSHPELKFSDNIIADALVDVPDLVRRYNYPIEVHSVVTSDGYILEAHRIPRGRDRNNQPGPRPVAFLMHGLLSSSADYLVLGPGNSLAYLLAEEGYDVWLGNARGNFYSRRHLRLDPDSRLNNDFWRFSWEEIGLYDIPAFVDYIVQATGQPKMHYIGHSQGGTVFLVLNSLRPEYNEKFISFQGLAPASYFENNKHTIFRLLAPHEKLIETSLFRLGFAEVAPRHPLITAFGIAACHSQSIFHPLCAALVTHELTIGNVNASMVPVFLGHAPAGASIRQVAHYGQTIRRNVFARFYHNPITNLRLYGRMTPPEFDMSKITTPSYLHYGLSDREVNYKDIILLGSRLGNTVGIFEAERPTFNHFDFIWGADVKEEKFDNVIKLLRSAEDKDSRFKVYELTENNI